MKISESQISYINAEHLGIDLAKYYAEFGEKFSQIIAETYSKDTSISFICGLGGNSADAFATVYALAEKGFSNICIYLCGRPQNFDNPITHKIWNILYELKKSHEIKLEIKSDCFAQDIQQADVNIEALIGDGFEGNTLNKRYKDIIKRFSHFKNIKIAIDKPTPNYTPDLTYSINYPKTSDAKVIKIDYPNDLEYFCGPGEFQALWKPNKITHKSKNGKLIVIKVEELVLDSLEKEIKEYPTEVLVKGINDIEEESLTQSDTILFLDLPKSFTNASVIEKISTDFSDKVFIFDEISVQNITLEKLVGLEKVIIMQSSDDEIVFSNGTIPKGKIKAFCIENSLIFSAISTKILLYSQQGQMKFFLNSNLIKYKDALLKTALYSTKNDCWLSIRAGVHKH